MRQLLKRKHFFRAVDTLCPDILLLTELNASKAQMSSFAKDLIEGLNSRGFYWRVWNLGEVHVPQRTEAKTGRLVKSHSKGYAGTVILSKYRIDSSEKGFELDPTVDQTGRVTSAVMGPYVLLCVYAPMSGLDNSPDARQRQVRCQFDEALIRHVKKMVCLCPCSVILLLSADDNNNNNNNNNNFTHTQILTDD